MKPEQWEGPVVQIENWCTAYDRVDFFTPPEAALLVLKGEVFGHPRKSDGSRVQTTAILDAIGLYVKTENNIYKLGTPDPEWLEWLKTQGKVYNPENPIKKI